MNFPTAHSTIYRNEAGEVTGWDTSYGYEPDYDPYNDSYYADEEPDWYGDAAECKRQKEHGNDADQDRDGTWTCCACGEDCTPEMNRCA
jgi:hypothetical protein